MDKKITISDYYRATFISDSILLWSKTFTFYDVQLKKKNQNKYSINQFCYLLSCLTPIWSSESTQIKREIFGPRTFCFNKNYELLFDFGGCED
ncbi:hypothetical protein BpHYR1_012921 [Brachionus plicatilis]|uniref:Uncharacterized protein n=1 Tax=Brachionus plicatilis TaxID=10195 RepID=A0A3M7P8N0_BRAPC|nr:hypothetical protein BpHYR1_012921 [Brachionus plicatilis]